MFALLFVAPVFGTGYAPEPVIAIPIVNGAAGAPALVSTQMSGIFTVRFESIQSALPLVIQNDLTYFKVCGTGGCANVLTKLTNTAPGTYSYSFQIPASPSGNVLIFIPARALIDEYGRAFPTMDTQIGAYSLPGAPPAATVATPPGTPAADDSGTYRQAVQVGKVESIGHPGLDQLIFLFVALALTCCGALLLAPSKKQ